MIESQVKLNKITVSYTGLFDFDGLYAAIIDWAKNYGFLWQEIDFKHKVPTKGAEVELKWALTKNITDYIGNEITITSHVWNMQEVEVDVGGKKKIFNSAVLYIWLEPKVLFDWQKKAESGGWLAKILGRWYNKIMEREYCNYIDELYYRTWNLHAIIKTYFDMQTKKHPYKRYMG